MYGFLDSSVRVRSSTSILLSGLQLSVMSLEGAASPFSESKVGNRRDGKCLGALEWWQIEGIRQIVFINNGNQIDRASKAHLVKCNIRRCCLLKTVKARSMLHSFEVLRSIILIINLVGNGSERMLHIEEGRGGKLRCLIPGGLRHWAAV